MAHIFFGLEEVNSRKVESTCRLVIGPRDGSPGTAAAARPPAPYWVIDHAYILLWIQWWCHKVIIVIHRPNLTDMHPRKEGGSYRAGTRASQWRSYLASAARRLQPPHSRVGHRARPRAAGTHTRTLARAGTAWVVVHTCGEGGREGAFKGKQGGEPGGLASQTTRSVHRPPRTEGGRERKPNEAEQNRPGPRVWHRHAPWEPRGRVHGGKRRHHTLQPEGEDHPQQTHTPRW